MDLKQVNDSIVSVILNLEDYKNLYSRNHAFSLRFNGKTITNSTGIAFTHLNEIHILCDGNIFAPYSNQCKLNNNIEITIQFNHKFSNQNKYNAQIMRIEHLSELQSSIENIDHQFKFAYLNHNNIHSHLKHKFGYLTLLKLTTINTNSYLFQHIISLQSLQNASITSQIGTSIFSISNPFGILCNNVLCNTVHHGILSTNLLLNNNNYIWLSDMKYLPGMEGGIIISNNQFIGIISIPLMIGNNASLTTIIPSLIILEWLAQKHTFNSHYLSTLKTCNSGANTCFKLNCEIYNAMQSVLPICIGSHWGSCILITNDQILTNAHIIRPYLKNINENDYIKRIELKNKSRYDSPKIGIFMNSNKNRKWLQCKLIYITHNNSPWDIAWLRCIEYKNKYKQFMKPIANINMEYKNIFNERNNVFVIGFGLIHPSRGLLPLVTSGILSKLVYDIDNNNCENVIILKTSADIHAGHSGGLLCDNNGYILGILTNNSVFDFDTNKSAINTLEKEKLWNDKIDTIDNKKISFIYPNLNSILPFSIVYELYKCVIDGGNHINVDKRLENVFQELDKPNDIIQAKWNLISSDKLNHELKYEKKMEKIMNSIPKHLLKQKKESKL